MLPNMDQIRDIAAGRDAGVSPEEANPLARLLKPARAARTSGRASSSKSGP